MSDNINNYESGNYEKKASSGEYGTYSREFSIYNDIGTIRYKEEVERTAQELRRDFYNSRNPQVIYVKEETRKEEVKKEETLPPVEEVKGKKGKKMCVKKRGFFFFIVLIVSVLVIGYAVASMFITDPAIAPYFAIFRKNKIVITSIPLLDPFVGLLSSLLGLSVPDSMSNNFFNVFLNNPDDIMGKVIAILIVAYMLVVVMALTTAIIGVCQKKKGNYFKKIKMGWIGILMLLIAIAIIVLGLFASYSTDISKEIIGYITGSANSSKTVGLGVYVLLVVPVIILICTNFTYKKVRNGKNR
ncbi:MAG: hypothetical protein K5765_03160 [Clostridia bacterium]|nr:hypothetical protein [Clostridia bacterium]